MTTINIAQEIAALERSDLLGTAAQATRTWEEFDHFHFWRIRGLASFWRGQPPGTFSTRITDLFIALHGADMNIAFLIQGSPITIFLGSEHPDPNVTFQLLKGMLPSALIEAGGRPIQTLYKAGYFANRALVTGVPTRKLEREQGDYEQIERVLRGMRGASWAYLVRAWPQEAAKAQAAREVYLQNSTAIYQIYKQQIQQSAQKTRSNTEYSQSSFDQSISAERIDKQAEYALELIESEVKRVQTAQQVGLWTAEIHLMSPHPETVRQLGALALGAFSGEESRPQPVRVSPVGGSTPYEKFYTNLSSNELTVFAQLPRAEYGGYQLTDYVTFDVDAPPNARADLTLGEIQHEGIPTGDTYGIHHDDLTRHALVVGVTGSGKTVTTFGLLHRLPCPFMVIEPAKSEYRSLKHVVSKLWVFTVGNERTSPFRLNPFEFELESTERMTHVQTHIDFLKAIFNAAFILYAPMPYVLEIALHEIYEDCGWNLATGTNEALPAKTTWYKARNYPIFPTLGRLYDKVATVTKRLGYGERIEQDVIAGLQARIKALIIGQKGLTLNTPRGIPLQKLLSQSVVLELESIGSDDEKTFIIGILLTRLYEYRRLYLAKDDSLSHLLVIEEAHRLLKHVETQVDTESSNLRSQAVETFSNMLSEIRAYGQGVLIADQVPTKLTPDVIKNTNLKIVHRLLAEDDRNAVGNTWNLTEDQSRHLTTLERGYAIISAEGADHPYLVHMDDYSSLRSTRPTDAQIYEQMRYTNLLLDCNPVPDWAAHLPASAFGTLPPEWKPIVDSLLTELGNIWARLMLAALFTHPLLTSVEDEIWHTLERLFPALPTDEAKEVYAITVTLGIQETLQARRAKLGLSFSHVEDLRLLLTTGVLQNDITKLDKFTKAYLTLAVRTRGPFAACVKCPVPCKLGAEVNALLTQFIFYEASTIYFDPKAANTKAILGTLAHALRKTAQTWISTHNADMIDRLAYCVGAHFAAHPNTHLAYEDQLQFGNDLASHLIL